MSSTVIADEVTGARRVEVRCDICRCEAPSAAEILAAHGLVQLGWACSGGTHVCGPCRPAETPAP